MANGFMDSFILYDLSSLRFYKSKQRMFAEHEGETKKNVPPSANDNEKSKLGIHQGANRYKVIQLFAVVSLKLNIIPVIPP